MTIRLALVKVPQKIHATLKAHSYTMKKQNQPVKKSSYALNKWEHEENNSHQHLNFAGMGYETQQADLVEKHFEGLETHHHGCVYQGFHLSQGNSYVGKNSFEVPGSAEGRD
jgi:hypothetical protein